MIGIVQAMRGAKKILDIATYMRVKGMKFKDDHSPVKSI
jgi:hypothetical protein